VADRAAWELPGDVVVHTAFTDVHDGDLSIDGGPGLDARRARVAATPWTWLRQEHGSVALDVAVPGEHAGLPADAAVTAVAGCTLAVQVADCAPVLLWAPVQTDGGGAVVAAVHAGWRGVASGVIGNAVHTMRGHGAGTINWSIGPCIAPVSYEFDDADLAVLADRFGDDVRSRTTDGRPALDLRAAVRSSLESLGVTDEPVGAPSADTALSDRHWSHRARGDRQRQAGVIRWERAAAVAPGRT